MYTKLSEIDLRSASVVMKCDFSVPVIDGAVTDEFRVDILLPTLNHLIDNNCKTVLIGKQGRPNGQVVPEMSNRFAHEILQAKLGKHIEFVTDYRDTNVRSTILNASPGQIFLLENLRFHPEEESDESADRSRFAHELKELGDIYIQEAFSDYQLQASNFELPRLFDIRALGFRFEQEIREIDQLVTNPVRPFIAVIGGAKLSTKLPILPKLAETADKVLIGGAMAYTFLKQLGHTTGDSLVEEDYLPSAQELLDKYGDKIELPIDHIVAEQFNEHAQPQTITGHDVPEGTWGLDIGPETIEKYEGILNDAKLILWNGPLGVFEWLNFANGTRQVGVKIADQDAHTVIGGGDTVAAVNTFELEHGVNHVSSGGGAMLEYIAKGTLPALEAVRMEN